MAPVRTANNPMESTFRGRPVDWRAWLALAWATWFAVLYVRTVLECRAPELLAALRPWLGR
jgi:hypothetical protein